MTGGDEAKLYVQLCKQLSLPGRIDELIVFLGLRQENLPGQGAAPAQVARVIFEQLKLRVPPQLEILESLLQGWGITQAPATPFDQRDEGKSERPPPDLGPVQKIVILLPQVVMGFWIIYVFFAAILLVLGHVEMAVFLLVVMGVLTPIILLGFSRLANAPKSIPEAQFFLQAHEGRKQYMGLSHFR